MRKNRKILLLTLLLGLLTLFFIFRNNDSTIRKELKDFAVKDTASITKIFLANRNGNSITLERKSSSEWTVNEKYNAKRDMIKSLLEVVYKIDIRTRVAKAAYNNVIKTLSASAIKCEIYLKGNSVPYKTYYVGGQTEDALGTFMMLENSNTPFVMQIPGFDGYLTPRYEIKLENWKETIVFRYSPDNIRSITINYQPAFKERSFSIEKTEKKYTVYSPENHQPLQHVDSVAVDNYLEFYRSVYFESWDKSLSPASRDSLLQTQPLMSIDVTDQKGISNGVVIYPLPINERSLTQQDSLGRPLKYDLDRMYAYLKGTKELVIVQHYTFDQLFRQLSDFDLERKKTGKIAFPPSIKK